MREPGLGKTYGYCVPDSAERGTITASRSPSKWELQTAARQLLPEERVASCHRLMADAARGVTIRRDGQKAWFSGVAVCGSVWCCAVCAQKIAEQRRQQLQRAIDTCIGQGGDVALVTLTFSHALYHRLDDLLPKLKKALRKLKSGRAWQAVKEKYGIIRPVRAMEVTHGRNGWHPHVHEIEFFRRPLAKADRESFRAEVFELWRAACEHAGLGLPNEDHGVDVCGATRAAQYVGKWGFASELTRSHKKYAQTAWAGRNPWELLADYIAGDQDAGALWLEFFRAFKGTRQLFGLSELAKELPLGELFSDEELAELEPVAPGDEIIDVVNIRGPLWARICRLELRGFLLQLAMQCKHELEGFLAHINETEPLRWIDDTAEVNPKLNKLLNWRAKNEAMNF